MTNLVPHVFVKDGRVVCASRDLATAFEKTHDYVLKTIRRETNYLKSASAQLAVKFDDYQEHFIKTFYVAENGKKNPMFELTQKGFLAIGLGFDGEKASALRWALLDEFERVKSELERLKHNDFITLCNVEYRASLPAYHAFANSVQALIEFAITKGARRADIDPRYYGVLNAHVNRALGLDNGLRPFAPHACSVHCRIINKNIRRIIRDGIGKNLHHAILLANVLDALDQYAVDIISDDERSRFKVFANAHRQHNHLHKAIDRANTKIALETGEI